MREQILAALSQYGPAALFAVVTMASIGVPLPVTLLLIVTGSLVAQGVMPMWWAIALAGAGSVIGDQIGYAIGRWGGAALVSKFAGMLGGLERMAKAEAHARRWGGPGVFLSRWLVTRNIRGSVLCCGMCWAKRSVRPSISFWAGSSATGFWSWMRPWAISLG